MSWKTIGTWALKIGIFALGHEQVIVQTVGDAKAKNIGGLAGDAGSIVSGLVTPKA